jgi:hypothetical protein
MLGVGKTKNAQLMAKNNLKNQVQFGLELLENKGKIEIDAQKIAKIYKTIGELISFFHQRGHYEKIEDIHKYMGNKNTGMFSILSQIYYKDFEDVFPDDIKEIIDSDEFYSSEFQYYRLPKK